MRRIFALLLVTPLLANCSDTATPATPSDAVATLEESSIEEYGPLEGETPVGGWLLADGEPAADEVMADEVTAMGAPATGAVMVFGNPDAGSNFPPATHDASLHAKWGIVPGTVVIDRGQKVTFNVNPGHRVGIYKPGTGPKDINVGTGNFILDATNRLALQAAPQPTISLTFHNPGRYLVICAVRRHFVLANQYGWVIVR
jgi:plastocyanin